MENVQENYCRKIDRFCKYMKYKGLNDNQVTVSLGISVGVIGKSKAHGRDLSAAVIEKILNFYTDLNGEWLLTGVGNMLKNSIIQTNQNGDNINGHNVTVNKTEVVQLIELLKKKDEQIDRLLTLLEKK